jgi:hypothetical protein
VYGKERKKNRKEKKIIIYVYERMKRIKKNKKRKAEWQERYERDESREKKKNKSARKDVTLLRDETSTVFPTMCNPTTRTSSVPRSHILFFPCTCPPF